MDKSKHVGGWVYRMKREWACAVVLCVGLGLAGCEGSAAGTSACRSPSDVALKVTSLTDQLSTAQTKGTITDERAGQIAGEIMAAARVKDPAAYCLALDEVRRDAGL